MPEIMIEVDTSGVEKAIKKFEELGTAAKDALIEVKKLTEYIEEVEKDEN